MSATEWKFVPVEPTREMLVAALKTNGACPIYAAMLDAAPVPPSVESLLENWTPSDQQAFAKFRDEHFPGEMSSHAIQSLGSAWKDGQANAQPQPAAHLTIPGALEWDQLPGPVEIEYPEYSEQGMGCGLEDRGITDRYEAMRYGYDEALDQFARILDGYGPLYTRADTHGVVGTHSVDGESSARGEQEISDDDLLKMADKAFGKIVDYDLHGNPITDYRVLIIGAYGPAIRRLVSLARQHPVAPVSAYTAVDMTTAAAGGFRDGQAELHAVLNQAYMALIGYLPGHRNDLTDAAIAACSAILFPVEAKAACSRCGDWGHIETEDSAHDCPECGPSVVERAVEAGVMNAPSKPKTCIECDQPYCQGVCVERGDQDYDRDQAAKGGDDE